MDGAWSETAIFEGAPPASGGATGWGISVSRTGEIQLSAIRARPSHDEMIRYIDEHKD